MSEEQEETPNYPKPPFEAAPPSEPLSDAASSATQDAPRVTRGFGGRASAKEEPTDREGSAHELAAPAYPAAPFPAPPFAVPESGPIVTPPVIGVAEEHTPLAPSFPVPPFEAPAGGPPAFEEPARTGSISFQEPGVTTRREPTLAESRARYQAEQEAERQREIEELHEENKRKWRRRLIGGVAVVGIVGVVALVYIASPERRCYNDVTHQEMPSSYCTSSYSGGGGGGGIFIFHHTGWFGSSPYSGSRFGGGSSSGGGDSSRKSSSSNGGVQRGGINPGSRGSSSS